MTEGEKAMTCDSVKFSTNKSLHFLWLSSSVHLTDILPSKNRVFTLFQALRIQIWICFISFPYRAHGLVIEMNRCLPEGVKEAGRASVRNEHTKEHGCVRLSWCNQGTLDIGSLGRRLNICRDWCWKGGCGQIMKDIVHYSKCIGEWPEVFAQKNDMICVRTLSPRPYLKKTCVLEWVWADVAHGRDMNNCTHEGWLQ